MSPSALHWVYQTSFFFQLDFEEMPRVGKLQIAFIASLLVSVILLANNMLSNAPFRDRIYSVTEVIKSIHGLEISSKISEILIMEGALFNRQGMMRELNASVKVHSTHFTNILVLFHNIMYNPHLYLLQSEL